MMRLIKNIFILCFATIFFIKFAFADAEKINNVPDSVGEVVEKNKVNEKKDSNLTATASSIRLNQEKKAKKIFLNYENVSSSFNSDDISLTRKNTMEIILFTKKFDLSLASLKPEQLPEFYVWYEADFQIVKNNNERNDLKFELIERPSGYVINRTVERNIISNKLQYRIRINTLKLLFGKNVNDDGEILLDELIPLDEYLIDKKTQLREQKPRREKVKSRLTPVELPSLANLNPTGENPSKPPIDKVEEIVKTDKVPEKIASKPPVSISNFQSPALNLIKQKASEERKIPKPYRSNFQLSVGVEKEFISSTNQFPTNEKVELEVNLDRIYAQIGFNLRQEESNWYNHFILSISKNVGENEYRVSPRYFGSVSRLYDLVDDFIAVGINAEFEQNGYINIRSRGDGIQKIDSSLLWAGIEARIHLSFYNMIHFKLFGQMKKTFLGNSDLGVGGADIQMDGSKQMLGVATQLTKHFSLMFAYEKYQLTSMVLSKIETGHETTSVKLIYN